MTSKAKLVLDVSGISEQADDVRAELTSLVEDDLNPLAETLQATFQEMSESIVDNLESAATRGKFSVRNMVDEILEDLARLAAEEFIRKPLLGLLTGGGGGGGIPTSKSQSAAQIAQLLSRASRNA